MDGAARAERARYRGPEGSRYEEQQERRTSRSPWRRLKRAVSRYLVDAAVAVFPWIYLIYMRFVAWTSRIEDASGGLYQGMLRHDRTVALLWHEEVFTVAWGYQRHAPHTLASTANFGRLITRMLELCGYQVFRGGSSKARSRERAVLLSMVRHMQSTPDCLYGITVDGSTGPAYELKAGGLLIAKACRAPIVLARTWASRRITLPTWDRTVIPLPFSRIRIYTVGPYWVPPDVAPDAFARLQAHVQDELLELAVLSREEVDGEEVRGTPAGYPPGWTRRWRPGTVGLRHGPWDLRWDEAPPWAHRPEGRASDEPNPARLATWYERAPSGAITVDSLSPPT